MLRRVVGGLAVVALGSSLLYARHGTLVTKDGHTYEGDITEKGEVLEVTGVAGARPGGNSEKQCLQHALSGRSGNASADRPEAIEAGRY